MLKNFLFKKWKIVFIITLIFVVLVSGLLFFNGNTFKRDVVGQDISINIEETTDINDNNVLYRHPELNFTIEYPRELRALLFKEKDGSETIVFQESKDKNKGFQFFIQSFEEGEVLTQQKILEDLPNITIEEPQEVVIGSNIRALIFWANDSNLGRTREVWFSNNGYLYEVTAYADFDLELAKILSTFSIRND